MTDERPQSVRNWRLIGAAAVAGIVVGAFAVYVNRSAPGNVDQAALAQCGAAVDTATGIASLVTGEVAAFRVATAPDLMTDLVFNDADGAETGIADFAGKTVLLNLWADWCVPCRAEMPSLDRLQADLGSDDFTVVAVNIDPGNDTEARAFLDEIGVSRLSYYVDYETVTFDAVRHRGLAIGLPATLLIDDKGCRIGVVEGPAVWDSADAKALLGAAMSG